MKKQLALSTIILLSGISNAQKQEYAISCNSSTPLIFPKQTLSEDTENINIVADKSEVDNKNDYLLTGNVALKTSQYYLSADKIHLNKSTKTSNATGDIKFQSGGIMVIGDSAVIKKQDKRILSTFEQAQYQYPATKENGQAGKITDNGKTQTFESVSYSLCPVGNTDWQLKADKITLDTKANLGVAKNVTFEFMGVPIFYTLHHEWALKGRASGFLTSSFASYNDKDSTKNGYQFRVPYYFNITPDRDFLLTLNQLTTRGSVIEGKYRQLLDKGRVEIEGHYLNKDDVTKKKRWLTNAKLDLSLTDKTELNIISKRVSDKNYFTDIKRDGSSDDSLMSSVNLAYADRKNNLTASIFAENEQLLDGGTLEYTRVPEISIDKKIIGLSNRELRLSVLGAKFKNKDITKDAGTRIHTEAEFVRDIKTDAYLLKPKFNISKTYYSIKDGTSNSKNRYMYSFGLDSRLFYERKTQLSNKHLIQTLTPRLAYNYTPTKNHNGITNFDSEEMGNSYEALFAGRKFTSVDRISNNNSIAFGLESDFIDASTGDTYLSLKIAQARYFNDTSLSATAIGNNDASLVKQKKYSNLVATADITINNITFDNTVEYDTKTEKVAKRNSTLSYIKNPKKFIALSHGDDGEQKSVGAYGAYPINRKIHLFAGINRSLTESDTRNKIIGTAYESCCWAVRIAHFKKYLSDNNYDKTTKFELVLKGLASSSSNLTERLRNEIPNYLVDLDK